MSNEISAHRANAAHAVAPTRMRHRAAAWLAALVIATGCAPARAPAAAEAPSMPQGAEWQGVYQGPNFIYLRIFTHGELATGEWRARGDRRGELTGKISGNMLDYRWREYSLNADNKSAVSGRGYFVYRVSPEGHEIVGVARRGRLDQGSLRLAKKRMDVAPDAPEGALMDTGDSTYAGDVDEGCYGCGFEDVDSGE